MNATVTESPYKLTEEDERLCAERVAKGAQFLDEKIPDWYTKINTDTLDMTDGSCCIIGQLYPRDGFTWTLKYTYNWNNKTAQDHGFFIEDLPEGCDCPNCSTAETTENGMEMDGPRWNALYAELKECWLGQIADRLNVSAGTLTQADNG